MQKTQSKSLISSHYPVKSPKHFWRIFCVGFVLVCAQQGSVVFGQGAAIGETKVEGFNQFNCSFTVDGIISNNIIDIGGTLYTNMQNMQGVAYADIAGNVEIVWDINPTVLASIPAMQSTLLPFTLTLWDWIKNITFKAINNAQTLACIVGSNTIFDQTAPSISSPTVPNNMTVITDTNLVLNRNASVDTWVGFADYQIYISRDITFPPNDTYTFISTATSATLVTPLYLRGSQYRRVEARDLLGNTVMSNPRTFTYNPFVPTGWPNTTPDAPVTPPTAVCGNAVQEGSESCDDGNLTNGDGCSATCTTEPTHYCGDNDINQPTEQCDDGNIANGDGCSAQCQTEVVPLCWDGSINQPSEACDDGNLTNGDGCNSSCAFEPIIVPISTCWNSIVEIGERCDDGNTSNNDNCSTDCTPLYTVYCGNWIREGDEVCDDGNTTNGDSCSAQCQRERGAFCGDGMINQPNENCDDGNRSEADNCGINCQSGGPVTCGNGNMDAAEQCDDGNLTNGDGCSQRCTNETTRFENEDTFETDIPDTATKTEGGAWNGQTDGTTTNDLGTTDSIKIGKKPSTQQKPDLITEKLKTVDEFRKSPRWSERELFEEQKFGTQSAKGWKNGPLDEHAAPYRSTPHPRGGLTGGKSFAKITGMSILVFFALWYDVDTYKVRYRMMLFKEPVMVKAHLTYYRSWREEG